MDLWDWLIWLNFFFGYDRIFLGGGFIFLKNSDPYLGKWPNLTNQMGWNQQPDLVGKLEFCFHDPKWLSKSSFFVNEFILWQSLCGIIWWDTKTSMLPSEKHSSQDCLQTGYLQWHLWNLTNGYPKYDAIIWNDRSVFSDLSFVWGIHVMKMCGFKDLSV